MFSSVISWDAALCGLPATRFPHQVVWASPDGPGRDQAIGATRRCSSLRACCLRVVFLSKCSHSYDKSHIDR
jgi:hypothetical protein